MKKILFLILTIAVFMTATSPAFAAGESVPADMQIGEFTSVDPATGTVVFQPKDSDQPMTMQLDNSLDPADVKTGEEVMVSASNIDGQDVVTEISVMFIGLKAETLMALLIVGFIGGLLSGFIGSGGAFVLTPAMMSLGVPGAVAVASNMCHKFPKALVGAYKRFRYGQVDVKLGLVIAASSIVGVQIGIQIQKYVLATWGSAGSDLYVSLAFVIILVTVGSFVFRDAWKLSKSGAEAKTPKLALRLQKIKIPPMIHFRKAGVVLSVWITVPIGVATGMLAATIAVGGFIGVPGMIYLVGATATVASATELIVAFVMGAWGSVQWALSGLIDIRVTLLILAASLFGVQLGALGTTYVKDYVIKIVMGTVMLIVAVSRGAKIPVYLSNLDLMSLDSGPTSLLNDISFWALVAALLTAGGIISAAMIKGILRERARERQETIVGRV